MKPKKPREEERGAYCNKCKRSFPLMIITGVLIDAVIAYLMSAQCPRRRAHRRWLQLI